MQANSALADGCAAAGKVGVATRREGVKAQRLVQDVLVLVHGRVEGVMGPGELGFGTPRHPNARWQMVLVVVSGPVSTCAEAQHGTQRCGVSLICRRAQPQLTAAPREAWESARVGLAGAPRCLWGWCVG